jgi:hypothetical protein
VSEPAWQHHVAQYSGNVVCITPLVLTARTSPSKKLLTSFHHLRAPQPPTAPDPELSFPPSSKHPQIAPRPHKRPAANHLPSHTDLLKLLPIAPTPRRQARPPQRWPAALPHPTATWSMTSAPSCRSHTWCPPRPDSPSSVRQTCPCQGCASAAVVAHPELLRQEPARTNSAPYTQLHYGGSILHAYAALPPAPALQTYRSFAAALPPRLHCPKLRPCCVLPAIRQLYWQLTVLMPHEQWQAMTQHHRWPSWHGRPSKVDQHRLSLTHHSQTLWSTPPATATPWVVQ